MNKQIWTLSAVALLALVLVACKATPTPTPAPTFEPTATSTPISTATPAPASTATSTPTPAPVPSLSGRVTDVATGRGIAGAKVQASLAGSYGWDYSATTTSDGDYAMFGLPPGDYLVRVTAPGYAREYYDNVTPSLEAKSIQVAALQETPGIDFVLSEGGSISGHVYQSDGTTPMAGADVFVRPSKYRYDEGFWTRTDSDGSYTVENLPLGSFRVTAKAEGFVDIVNYYKDVYGWDKASDVVVTPPDDTSGIDIRLDLAGSISGFVYASDGVTPISNIWVIADDQTGRFNDGFGNVSNSDGSYTIKGILPGRYTVRIEADRASGYADEFYNSISACNTDQVIVSAGNSTPNINFTLDEGGWVTGHVCDEDTGEPLAVIELFGYLPDGCFITIARTAYDGSYKFVLRPGRYLIGTGTEEVNLLGSSYVPEWYDNAYGMSDATLVNVTLHQETGGIDLYLAKAGSISGHVYDEDGNPVGDASVYAFSDVYPGNGANTQPDGSYTIKGLPSGSYTVQVTVSGYVSEYYDNVTNPESATKVTVNAPDNTPGIDFRVSRAFR